MMSNEEKIIIKVEDVLERLFIDIEKWHTYNQKQKSVDNEPQEGGN